MSRKKINEEEQQFNVEIGKKIRAWRLYCKLNFQDLADLLGVRLNQICLYERGKGDIRASKLIKIAKVFNIPVSELFPENTETQSLSPDLLKLISFVKNNQIKEAINFLGTLQEQQ